MLIAFFVFKRRTADHEKRIFMKKATAILLAVLQLLLFASCSGAATTPAATDAATATAEKTAPSTAADARAVPNPKQTPDYSFDHTPTIDEMRETAVQAMRDMLTIQWYTPKTVKYNKLGAVSHKNFVFYTEREYRGLPYTSAGKGLFQFLEYYDTATGEMSYTDSASFNETIGNTCASCPSWALFTVATSMRGRCISNFLTIPNGFYPLGEIRYPDSVSNFADYSTPKIIQENGKEKVLEAYALLQPADLLVYSVDSDDSGHTMMAIEKAVVVRNDAGAIDADQSYIMIQDQRADDYSVKESGHTFTQSGRTDYKATFTELFKDCYIPVSIAELMGTKPYEKTAIQIGGDLASLDDFQNLTVTSNRPIAVAKFVLIEEGGKETVLARHLFDRVEIESELAFSFSASILSTNLSRTRLLPSSGTFTVQLQVIAADGVSGTASLEVVR